MKKYLLGVLVALGCSPAFAADSWKELFKETEGRVLDWAIASSVEAGYARDMIGGRNAVLGQFPVIFVSRYINGDLGYVTGYDERSRGSIMVGGTFRINRLIQDIYNGDLSLAQRFAGEGNWDKLWVGPWIAYGWTAGEVLGGIKGGFRFDGFLGTF